MQYTINRAFKFCWGTCTLSFFHVFSMKRRPMMMLVIKLYTFKIFILLISLHSSKVLWYQVPFRLSRKGLKVTRLLQPSIFCILKNNDMDCALKKTYYYYYLYRRSVYYYYCKVLKIFNFKLFSSLYFNILS